MGTLAVLALTGCPLPIPEQTWCGTFSGKEMLTVLTYPLAQDMAGGARCYTLRNCGGMEYALALEPDGKCNVRVDFSTPEQGTVRPGGTCERGTSRVSGMSKDVGTVKSGTVTIRDGRLDADIQFEVLVHTPNSRIGGTQDWMFREARAESSVQDIPGDVCRIFDPDPTPEDFSSMIPCQPEDFVERGKADEERVIRFGGDLGAQYSPRCLIIEAGQSVTFEGPFNEYSLQPGTPEVPTLGSPYNPIYFFFVGERTSYSFPRPGDYIYSNPAREAQGMRGLIRVR